jgi:uncharacterized protein YdeI (YjbR/CyaY-like superfamily)
MYAEEIVCETENTPTLEEKIEKLINACNLKCDRLDELEEEEQILDEKLATALAVAPRGSNLLKEQLKLAEQRLKLRKY